MALVVLALDDVGLAVRLQESLEAAGHAVTWDSARVTGPDPASALRPDVVVITGGAPAGLSPVVDAWRALSPPPALLVVGAGERTRAAAAAARVHCADGLEEASLVGAVERALADRYAGRISPGFALAALGLRAEDGGIADAGRIIAAARAVEVGLVREALRWHVSDYVAGTPLIEALRERRALDIPEVEFTFLLDGARTVGSLVRSGRLEPSAAARLVWALASCGAATLTPEPPDTSTLKRRAVSEARRHLRARRERLSRTSLYDVLEVTPKASPAEIRAAVAALSVRYSPERLGEMDLGGVASLVAPLWREIERAAAVLTDAGERGRYNQALAARAGAVTTTWARAYDLAAAEQALAAGQRALIDGDAFKAVSSMAAACRAFPHHPDYEASLAWARYRAELARGKERDEAAGRERRIAEEALVGRRPWPRALVALALLCVADEDPEAARWHLREALACDPSLPIARQMLARLTR